MDALPWWPFNWQNFKLKAMRALTHGVDVDIHEVSGCFGLLLACTAVHLTNWLRFACYYKCLLTIGQATQWPLCLDRSATFPMPAFTPDNTASSLLQCVDDDPLIAKIHAHAEVFSPKVEFVFSYLQVCVGRKSE